MKLRIGLIGLGDDWQTRHRPALRVLQDRFDVRAVYSTISKLAENCAAEFQADPVDGYRALVSRCDVDAVMVLKRSWLGWLPVVAACEAGKAIYFAGELDFDPSQDASVRTRIEKSGVAFMTEFPRRFAPATLRLKELIATKLGQPRLLFCHRRVQASDIEQQEDVQKVANSELVELVDWVRYVVGEDPVCVTGSGHANGEHSEYRWLSLRFLGGDSNPSITAQISCGTYIPTSWHEAATFRPPAAMQICCDRGVAFVDLPSSLVWFDDAGRHMESLETETPVGEQLLTQFHRAVTSLVRNLNDLDDAYRAVEILEAAKKSDRQGRRIEI